MTFEEWLTEGGIDPALEYSVEINFLRATWEKSAALEREACARVCERLLHTQHERDNADYAAAIRKRGNP